MTKAITLRRGKRQAALVAVTALAMALGGCGVLGKGKMRTTPTIGKREPVLSRIESGATVDDAIASMAVVLPPPAENAQWAQPGGSASKSYGNLALADAPQRAWTASIAGSNKRQRLAASPVVGNGSLFVYDTAGVIHAFDAKNGGRLWSVSFHSKANTNALFGGGVSYADNRVYVTTGLGEVAQLDAASGKELWRVQTGMPLRGSPTVAYGAVYVMTQDNQILALSLDDGSTLWNESGAPGQTGVFGVAAPAVGQSTVLAGYSTGELVAYRYENGRQLWNDALARTSIATSVSTLTDIDADPIIDSGRVFALGQGGRMAAYELVTGQRIWELSLAGISTPAVAGDWIFTLTDQDKLLCIAKATGKVRWVTQLQNWENVRKKKGAIYWTGPVLANSRLWVANSRGEIASVSSADGTVQPFTRVKDSVSLAPVVAGSTLYVLDDGGHITAWR
ncbi:MAG: PQQ-binding-like beta-propeller repeat protein [Sphingomonadales bacterium]|nr:PQQ-binding-like beta-propeller repeat protein [Sphingomonadales bacterium]MDE2568523.1 PQQ-binding-like beta-propeller repeat protein [Sphingomonadales bacterium]